MLDHIEWDLRSTLTPEEYTTVFCADVGLSSEAIPMIAHAIHEELLKHKKDVIEWGVLEGGGEWKSHAAGLGNAWGRKGKGPKRMKGIWRDWAEIVSGDYSARIEELTAEELEKKELERERAARCGTSRLCVRDDLRTFPDACEERRASFKELVCQVDGVDKHTGTMTCQSCQWCRCIRQIYVYVGHRNVQASRQGPHKYQHDEGRILSICSCCPASCGTRLPSPFVRAVIPVDAPEAG